MKDDDLPRTTQPTTSSLLLVGLFAHQGLWSSITSADWPAFLESLTSNTPFNIMSEATTSSSSNTDIDYFHWSYTDAQVISLCVASTISGCLSLYGSGSIIHSIVKERRSRSRLYERFVLAVSVYDVIATTSVVLGTFMVPQHTDMLLAWGNTQTVSAVLIKLNAMICRSGIMYNEYAMCPFVILHFRIIFSFCSVHFRPYYFATLWVFAGQT